MEPARINFNKKLDPFNNYGYQPKHAQHRRRGGVPPSAAAWWQRRSNQSSYVSSSPWNIYDLIVDFLDIHGLPVEALFLRDWSSAQGQLVNMQHQAHKLEQIERLFALDHHLPFVLIGDSGRSRNSPAGCACFSRTRACDLYS